MNPSFVPPQLVFELARKSRFSFLCRACGICCSGKAIRVGPYEVLRLSRNLGLSTTRFLNDFTEEGGIVLRTRPDGSCLFLESGRCRVHPDRPLACRLYPLGMKVDGKGRQSFARFPLHSECQAECGTDSRLDSFLRSQGIAPFLAYNRRYTHVLRRMIGLLMPSASGTSAQETAMEIRVGGKDRRRGRNPLFSPWLDVDRSVTAFCRKMGFTPPQDMDKLMESHLAIMEEWIESLGEIA